MDEFIPHGMHLKLYFKDELNQETIDQTSLLIQQLGGTVFFGTTNEQERSVECCIVVSPSGKTHVTNVLELSCKTFSFEVL